MTSIQNELPLKGLPHGTTAVISLSLLTSRGRGCSESWGRETYLVTVTEVLSLSRQVVRTGPEVSQHLREEEQAWAWELLGGSKEVAPVDFGSKILRFFFFFSCFCFLLLFAFFGYSV